MPARFTITIHDPDVVKWIKTQNSMSTSVSLLIKQEINQNGYCDFITSKINIPETPLTKKRGRPRKNMEEPQVDQNVSDLFKSASSIESNVNLTQERPLNGNEPLIVPEAATVPQESVKQDITPELVSSDESEHVKQDSTTATVSSPKSEQTKQESSDDGYRRTIGNNLDFSRFQ